MSTQHNLAAAVPATGHGKNQTATPAALGADTPVLLPSLTGRNSNDLGTLTHALVGFFVRFMTEAGSSDGAYGATGSAPTCRTPLSANWLERMFLASASVIEGNANSVRTLAVEASGLAYRYLTEFPPAPPWRLLGIEYDTGGGKVDLAWVNANTSEVFFDELKTSRISNGRLIPATWATQALRYTVAGHARFGDAFLGTRLVPLMSADTTRLFTTHGPPVRLAPTPEEPTRSSVYRPMGGPQ